MFKTTTLRLQGAPAMCSCLAISGDRLVGGLSGPAGCCVLGVWDLGTLALEHTLRQPNRERFRALEADEGRVWARLKGEVVVWGEGAERDGGTGQWGWAGQLRGFVAWLVARSGPRRSRARRRSRWASA